MTTPVEYQVGKVLTGRKRWAALAFLALGVSMIILDATVVNVAIPTMVKDLGLTTSDAEWVSAAYSLTFASLLIFAGRVADRIGRRLHVHDRRRRVRRARASWWRPPRRRPP